MINEFENLVKEYQKLPSIDKKLTYLEICQYPGRRFEEICSRLLCYYFDPVGHHLLNALMLFSLFEILNEKSDLYLDTSHVKIEKEVYYKEHFLDILIETPTVVLGIENKINASLYNDLALYGELIDSRTPKNGRAIKIVLSLNKIWRPNEVDKIVKNGFVNILYKDFFKKVRANLEIRQHSGDSNYLLFLNDFINTIENMTNPTIVSPEFDEFYYKNYDHLTNLVGQYDAMWHGILEKHKNRMKELIEPVKLITGNPNWRIWDSVEEGIFLYLKEDNGLPAIGVECVFIDAIGNPFDKSEIYLSTWDITTWAKYEPFIRNRIAKEENHHKDYKTYVLCDEIDDNDDGKIIKALADTYTMRQQIIEDYKKANHI